MESASPLAHSAIVCACTALTCFARSYRRAIQEYDAYKLVQPTDYSNASAPLFITAPSEGVSSTLEGFCQEILAGGILSIAVLALGDEVRTFARSSRQPS